MARQMLVALRATRGTNVSSQRLATGVSGELRGDSGREPSERWLVEVTERVQTAKGGPQPEARDTRRSQQRGRAAGQRPPGAGGSSFHLWQRGQLSGEVSFAFFVFS